MMTFWEIFDASASIFDIGDRIIGVFQSIRYGDYGSAKANGLSGIASEAVRGAVGSNVHRFTLPRGSDFNFNRIRKLLGGYGIVAFARTYDHKNIYFSVKKRQARWAEYILLNAGVELASPTFDQRNPGYVGRHGPGWMPTPWAEKEGSAAKTAAPSTPPPPPADQARPLDRINRWLDDLLTF